jgi:hypothetical protein
LAGPQRRGNGGAAQITNMPHDVLPLVFFQLS